MSATLDSPRLHRAMHLYLDALRAHREELDSLNVYPVPDGDTGTNLMQTQQAVVSALEPVPSDAGLQSLGVTISRASLTGARGNSGVILSQVLRGLTEALPVGHPAGGPEIVAALADASREAYRAVARPKEGTMLSVLRDGADRAATAGDDSVAVLTAALGAARSSLDGTRELLPELREAGVVDAGGKGIVLLLDALRSAVADVPLSEPAGPAGPVGRHAEPRSDRWSHQFEVQYLLEASDDAIPELQAKLSDLGDSLVIIGGGGTYHVHVHTDQPDRGLALGREAGRTGGPSVVNLGEQVAACAGSRARAIRVAGQACGLVAVAGGDGLAATLQSLGAIVVDPQASEVAEAAILAAIETVASEFVAVLTVDDEERSAAERAALRSGRSVHLVEANAIPPGLSAAAAFNPFASLDENAKAMEEAATACRSGDVVHAAGDGDTKTGEQWIGLVDGEPVHTGDRADAAAVELARRLVGEGSEVLTLVAGRGSAAGRPAVERALREALPGLHVQVVDGGQPEPAFSIGVE